jgi:predicted small lipoprotein YifL
MSRILPVPRVLLFALACAVSLTVATGCGLKGDLVLPPPVENDSDSEDSDA